ncbi:MAG TPA: adenylate/guanylate cyclase domain-containing protein [Jiangellaceae bacterium]|nr:adenylate/guanylate cyclase domain-containing protein [Jiangellaceae bacterium]
MTTPDGPTGQGADDGAPAPSPDDLEALLLGATRRYTREEVAEISGLDPERVLRYWRALGFADLGEGAMFTAWDVEALRGVTDLVDSGVITERTAVQMVRALGRMTGRLGEWHVETLAEIVQGEEGRPGSRLTSGFQFAERLLPEFERLLIYTWRRKLAASARRLVEVGDDGQAPLLNSPATVGFADLVSFTRLSRGLSTAALGDLVEEFEAVTNDVIVGGDGRVVKTLGDEVVFLAPTPRHGADIGCRLIEKVGRDPHKPDIRVGLATGPIVLRMGDVFGTPTNLAARLTTLAERNVVLADSATSDALSEDADFALRAVPPTTVRGIGVVAPFSVTRRP